MITIISRIVHYGLKNLVRSGLLSTTTTAIVMLSLLVFAGLIFTNAATNQMISFLKDKIDIGVHFKTNTPEDEILKVKSAIEDLSEVKSVEYVSADEALERFREKNEREDRRGIIEALSLLDNNPLEPVLNIKAFDPSEYASIAGYLEAPDLKQHVSYVSYAENQTVIERLIAIIGSMNRAGIAATILLSLIAGLVVFNTIRLVIYSNRDEIGIMRAVGASNALVRGPYVIEGAIIGAIAAAISLLLILAAFLVAPLIVSGDLDFDFSIPGFDIRAYFFDHFFILLFYQLVFGIVLTGVSSFIAVRRYLKN